VIETVYSKIVGILLLCPYTNHALGLNAGVQSLGLNVGVQDLALSFRYLKP